MARFAPVRLLTATLLAMALFVPLAVAGFAAPPAAPDNARERLIVVFQPGVQNPAAAARDLGQRHNGRVDLVYQHALKGFVVELPPQAGAALAADPRVAYVERDQRVAAFDVPTGVDRMEAEKKTGATDNGSNKVTDVDIAVIDTGIDHTHPDLAVVAGANCTGGGTSGICIDGWPGDGHSHGTHVAGTAAAKDNGSGVVGVAPGARLYAVKVLDDFGSGYMSWVVAGIDWVTARAGTIEVANMSLGCLCYSQALDDALTRSTNAGVVYAVAAGNSTMDAASFSPANHPQVIAVSAMADFDGKPGAAAAPTCRSDVGTDDTFASFSNYGAVVDVAAPGVCIKSTVPGGGYAWYSGTSMASPHAAGAAALYVVQNGRQSWSAVRTGLRGAGWAIANNDPTCGFTGARSSEPFLMLAPCGAPAQTTHDVAVTGLTAPASVTQGSSASISVAVANQGSYAESFTVTLTDTSVGATIGSQPVSNLAAGAATTLTFTWSTSASTPTGNHTLMATAATVGGETDTADNSKSATVAVLTASHDVAVTGVTAPAEVAQGASASVSVTVTNQGGYAESFSVTLTNTTANATVASQTVSNLAAGASATLTFTWTTSANTAPGAHTLTATASAVSGETDTADNSKATTVTVKSQSGSMHVGDLDGASSKRTQGLWQATVTITVHDAAENPVAGATVSGTFTQGAWSTAVSCTTDAAGRCAVTSGTFPATDGKASFAVTGVAHSTLSYQPSANHDPDGDSKGTTINLAK